MGIAKLIKEYCDERDSKPVILKKSEKKTLTERMDEYFIKRDNEYSERMKNIHKGKMKIYLDDLRTPPSGFTLVKDARTAIEFITENWDRIEEISLDHDLGDEELYGNGYRVICELEDFVFNIRPSHLPFIHVHSANPVGRKRMESGIKNIERMIKG